MEILKKYKCIEYGIDNRGMLFLMEDGGGFVMDDTPENRKYIEKEFDCWTHGICCEKCPCRFDCDDCDC